MHLIIFHVFAFGVDDVALFKLLPNQICLRRCASCSSCFIIIILAMYARSVRRMSHMGVQGCGCEAIPIKWRRGKRKLSVVFCILFHVQRTLNCRYLRESSESLFVLLQFGSIFTNFTVNPNFLTGVSFHVTFIIQISPFTCGVSYVFRRRCRVQLQRALKCAPAFWFRIKSVREHKFGSEAPVRRACVCA